jgi:hypothetical protein
MVTDRRRRRRQSRPPYQGSLRRTNGTATLAKVAVTCPWLTMMMMMMMSFASGGGFGFWKSALPVVGEKYPRRVFSDFGAQ